MVVHVIPPTPLICSMYGDLSEYKGLGRRPMFNTTPLTVQQTVPDYLIILGKHPRVQCTVGDTEFRHKL